jgi:hypothetical protein
MQNESLQPKKTMKKLLWKLRVLLMLQPLLIFMGRWVNFSVIAWFYKELNPNDVYI